MSKLALGTVQFGLNYGVANKSGQIKFSVAKDIIQLSKEEKIDLIDTAIAYGESEKVIGKIGIQNFKIVSKLPDIPQECLNIESWIKNEVNNCLERLQIKSIYGLLVHQTKNLLDKKGEIIINTLKKRILNADEWIEKSKNKRLSNKDLCITFDDNLKSQYDIAIPVLKKYNLKAFFFIY